MATRKPKYPETEAWWETALAAVGLLVFLVAITFALLLLSVPEPTEQCFTTAWGEEVCREQRKWE